MWIKETSINLGTSKNANLNFLYQESNVFIMDNHLAAGWAWLNQIDPNQSHYLLHIDKHYDLLGFQNTVQTQIIDAGIDLKKLTLDEYLDLRQLGTNGDSWPLFRWDNYIVNLKLVYPDIYSETIFATFKDGTAPKGFIDREIDFLELLKEIDFLIENKTNGKWILNLDIDYFFNHINGKRIQVLTDEVIRELAVNIGKIIDILNSI